MRSLIMAVFLAGLFALAWPNTGAAAGSSLTVDGVRVGDTVNVYRIIQVDEAGTPMFTADYGVDLSAYLAEGSGSADLRAFVDQIAARVHATGQQPDASAVASTSQVVFDGLEDGQYLISVVPPPTNSGLVYQGTTANAGDEVVLKSQPITITKTIDGSHESDAYGVGQRAVFELATFVPWYPENAVNRVFRVVDVSSPGLAFGKDDIQVVCAGETLEEGKHFAYTERTVEAGVEHVLEFDYERIAPLAGQSLTVSVSALVTEEARVGGDIPNTAYVYYLNNPYIDIEGEPDSNESRLHVYGVRLLKVEAGSDTPLAGAEFEALMADDAGTEELALQGETVKVRLAGTMVTDEAGIGSLSGLARGTYYIRETKAPEGYSKINGILRVDVSSGSVETSGDWAGYVNAGSIENEKATTPDPPNPPSPNPSPSPGGETGKAGSGPKTGDETDLLPIVIIAAAAIAVVAIAAVRRRRR